MSIAMLVAVALVAIATPSSAASPPALPPQGLYEGCSPGSRQEPSCLDRLETIAAAGFRYVLNYSAWYGSEGEVLSYANAAAALGLRLIWPLNRRTWRGRGSLRSTYSTFYSTRRESNSIARAINLVAEHPATWGFYIGDELQPSELSRVRWLSAIVRRLAPDEPQLYVARPGIRQLQPFAQLADFVAADPYPVGSKDPSVREAARSARLAASATGARTAMVLQTFSWSQYDSDRPIRYPGAITMRRMRDAAICYARPKLILWYSYKDILQSDDPERRWANLLSAAFSPGASC